MLYLKRIISFIGWTFIIALSVYFFFDNVIAYFYGYRSRLFGTTLFNNQLWVAMHMTGGTLTLLLGPLQFWKYLRTRFVKLHRNLGKIYMLGIALACAAALRLSLISTCVPCRISLF